MDSKTCTKCGETKPLDAYHRSKKAKDGRRARCKACRAEDKAEYNARPEVKAHSAEYKAKYRQANRDAILAYRAEYYQAHPHVRWEARYRERARSYGYTPRVSSFTMGELVETHGPTCVHCGGPFESLDHFPQPISRGGAHSLDNCRPSCMNCQSYSWRENFTA